MIGTGRKTKALDDWTVADMTTTFNGLAVGKRLFAVQAVVRDMDGNVLVLSAIKMVNVTVK